MVRETGRFLLCAPDRDPPIAKKPGCREGTAPSAHNLTDNCEDADDYAVCRWIQADDVEAALHGYIQRCKQG